MHYVEIENDINGTTSATRNNLTAAFNANDVIYQNNITAANESQGKLSDRATMTSERIDYLIDDILII